MLWNHFFFFWKLSAFLFEKIFNDLKIFIKYQKKYKNIVNIWTFEMNITTISTRKIVSYKINIIKLVL